MRKFVNYFAFLLILLMVVMAFTHPENVRGLLGRKLSGSAQVIDRLVLAVLLIATAYVAGRQGIEDYRAWKKRK